MAESEHENHHRQGNASRELLKGRSREFNKKVCEDICEWSTAEVSALSHILNGLSIAADSLLKRSSVTYVHLMVEVDHPLPAKRKRSSSCSSKSDAVTPSFYCFLDTLNSTMMYDSMRRENLATMWTLIPNSKTPPLMATGSIIIPNSVLVVSEKTERKWRTITFQVRSGNAHLIINTKEGSSELKLAVNGEEEKLYMVPLILVKRGKDKDKESPAKQIVACRKEYINGDPHVWFVDPASSPYLSL